MERIRDVGKGAAALGALLALIFGVPLALVAAVGWPLPRSVPSWDALSEALTLGRVDESTVFKVVALVVWLAWLQTTVAAITEAAAVVRRHAPSRAPLTSPSVQLGVGRLVAAAAVLLTSFSAVRPAGATPLPVPMSMAAASSSPLSGGSAVLGPASTTDPSAVVTLEQPPPSSTKEWLVHRRETLWGIASAVLGDGARYTEIADLNRGRGQPDGRVFTDAQSIRPGWILVLPDQAAVEAAPTGSHRVVPGDTLALIARARLGDASRWSEIWDLNRDRTQSQGGALVDADKLRPGWVLRLPSDAPRPDGALMPTDVVPVTEPAEPMPAAEPSEQGEGTVHTGEVAGQIAPGPVTEPPVAAGPAETSPQDASEEDSDFGSLGDALGWAGGLVLAAGALVAMEKARRRRLDRHGIRGLRRSPRPAGDLELVLRRTEGLDDVAWADATVRQLESDVSPGPVDGSPLAVLVELKLDGDLEVWWETPRPQPADGWSTSTGGRSWTRRRTEPAIASSALAPWPGLVTLGRKDAGSEVLVNLEVAGLLSVHGDGSAIDLVRAMVLELATTPFADVSTVLLCGFPIDGVDHLDRVVTVDPDAALCWMRERVRSTRPAPAGPDDVGHPWEPVTVVCGHGAPDDGAHEEMLLLATPGSGAAVVLVGTARVGDGWSLQVEGGRGALEPLGIRLRVHGASADNVCRLAVLLGVEGGCEHAPLPDDPGLELEDPTPMSVGDMTLGLLDSDLVGPKVEGELDDADLVIQVLGEVAVEHGPDVTNPQQLELLTFLALHRRGASSSEILDALWPEGRAVKTFQNSVSRLRKTLGRGGDGELFLPYGDGQRYVVSPSVATDWDRFLRLVRQAEHQAPNEALLLLHEAMTMVHGRPFRAPRGYEWAITSGVTAEITETVKLAALRLGQLYLDAGDASGALWAAKQGRRAVETVADSQRLTHLTMEAHRQLGDTPAALAAHQELLRACDELDCEPIPEVQAAYREIRAGSLAH